MSEDSRYDAFISYCHHPTDRRWAKWLHRRLETYRTPRALRKRGVARRLRRVFRDEDELAASTDLGERIDHALKSSKFLVVICSPRTPLSRWVGEEIERFARMGGARNIVTLLVEGDPASAFPPPLFRLRAEGGQAVDAAEPLAADVRVQEGESTRRRRRNAALKVLAAILGVEFDELRQREQERALRRLALSVSVATAGLILLASISMIAWTQRQEAIRRLGDSLIAQADGQLLLYQPGADALYADAFDAFATIGADTGVAELALVERLLSSPPPLGVLAGHDGAVARVLFGPDGRSLVSAGSDGTLRRWNLATQTQSASWHVSEGAIVDMASLPDGHHAVYVTATGTIAVADLRNGQVTQEVARGRAGLSRVAASSDGRFVAWGGADGLLEVADLVGGGTRTLPAHPGDVTGLCFHPDGRFLISSSSEHTVRVWNAVDGRELGKLDYGTLIYGDLAPLPDGRGVLIGRSGLNLGAYIWDLTDDSLPNVSLDTHGAVNPGSEFVRVVQTGAVTVSPDTRYSFEGVGFRGEVAIGGEGGHIVVWDLSMQKDPRAVLIAHAGRITSLTYSSDGRYLASSGSDGTIMLWPRVAFRRTANALLPYAGFTRSTAVSHDGTMVAAGGDDGVVQVWDASTRRLLRSLSAGSGITKVAFSPDDQFIVYKEVKSPVLHAWRFGDGETTQLEGHTDAITDLAFIPTPGRLVSTSRDRTLRLWTLGTDATQRVFDLARTVLAAAPFRGRAAIALATDIGDVVLYDLDKGREVWSARHARGNSPRIAVLDDSVIASGGRGGVIRLWDARNGQERLTLTGHGDEITALVGVRGRWLFSTSWDHTLRVWDLQTGAHVRTVRREEMFGYSMALAPDGRFVAAAGESPLRVWPLRIEPRWVRYRETLTEASQTLSTSENDAEALRTLGEWYARLGDSVLGTELLERADRAGAAVPPTELAGLHWMNGRLKEARDYYDRALQAGEITATFHKLRVSALSAGSADNQDDSDGPASFWASLWQFARRSRTADGSAPGAALDAELASWAARHTEHELTKRLRLTQQLIELRSDPLQAMAPIPGIVLPGAMSVGAVDAQLFNGGPVETEGRLFQMTTVPTQQGSMFRLHLSSAEFAPRLVVAEIDGVGPFEVSSRVGSTASLLVTPRRGGTLLIMCTSVNAGQVGSFSLRVEQLGSPSGPSN